MSDLPELTPEERAVYEWQMWIPGLGEEGERRQAHGGVRDVCDGRADYHDPAAADAVPALPDPGTAAGLETAVPGHWRGVGYGRMPGCGRGGQAPHGPR